MSEYLMHPESFYSSLNERKKIYCNDCKYYKIFKNKKKDKNLIGKLFPILSPWEVDLISNDESSMYICATEPFYNKKNKMINFTHYPNINNKNNNCKYYKRKWYKFWIKEK